MTAQHTMSINPFSLRNEVSAFSNCNYAEREMLVSTDETMCVYNQPYVTSPEIKMLVEGKPLRFLVDTGATRSCISLKQEKSDKFRESDCVIYATTASGKVISDKLSVPLQCIYDNQCFALPFALSEECPFNLLGRDALCKMKMMIVCDEESGVTCEAWRLLRESEDLYVYMWLLTESETLRNVAKGCMREGSDFQSEGELHVTAHVSVGQDVPYEEVWSGDVTDQISCTEVYWDDKHCAGKIKLETGMCLFDVADSFPHVSLAKSPDIEWKDNGPFLKSCVESKSWQAHLEGCFYNPELKAWKQAVKPQTWLGLRSIRIIRDCQLPNTACQNRPIPQETMSQIPQELWAKDRYDVGLIKNCPEVRITPKSNYRPHKPQYPVKRDALEGITPVFESLLERGIIIPCADSPVNTPIFPVKKIRDVGQPEEWRFVQDLQAVNAAVVARAPNVPNPYTILSQIPSDTTHFTSVDISNAFFSVPVHKNSQFWFAFTFKGKRYTFTRLCQGYCESPTIYNDALHENLLSLKLPKGVALLQYVDDLLLCAPSREVCLEATLKLLNHLAENGHKVNIKKVSIAEEQVTFLGHVISKNGKHISEKRISGVLQVPKPRNKKQMMTFLGMTSYCRTFIINYSEIERPLSQMIFDTKLSANQPITWTKEGEEAFEQLKLALQSAPTLGLPDQTKPFFLHVHEKRGHMLSVLLQDHGMKLRPVGYFSGRLDAVAAGLPACLRAIAACEKAVLACRDFVGYGSLTLFVPHSVSLILNESKTSHLSAARWYRYTTSLMEMPNITIKRCNTLNPATLMPLPDEGEPHCCITAIQQVCAPRPDLLDVPIPNAELTLYVDGSASKTPGGVTQSGFAVVTDSETLDCGSLPQYPSAQAAELYALIRACKLAEGKTACIYTDSRYAFGVCHDFGTLWKHRDFLKSDGKPILHKKLVSELLDAITLPAQLAIVKCQAHTGRKDIVSAGNARADAAAKRAALSQPEPKNSTLVYNTTETAIVSLSDMQAWASLEDKAAWKKAGATYEENVWLGPNKKPCLPSHFFPTYCVLTHGVDHVSKGGMIEALRSSFFTKGFTVQAEAFCKNCLICAQRNIGRNNKQPMAGHPQTTQPFQHVMMDYIELTPHKGKKYCLVMVDMFSKWTEAMPTSKADSKGVAKMLLQHIVPRWGIPRKISSDNGSHFVNSAIKTLSEGLKLDLTHHCSYHPESGGAVERENGTIKLKLTKCMDETGLGWTDALPLVLMSMRMRARQPTGLSPFEILMGRPPHMGWSNPSLRNLDLFEGDNEMVNYCINLAKSLSAICVQVKQARPDRSAKEPLHQLQPGDWVVIRDLKRKHWKQKRWTGPHLILLVTHTAVKVEGRGTWVHASHCRKLPSCGSDQPSPSTPGATGVQTTKET